MAAEATTEGEVMTNEELIREALGVMHCLGIDNLRAKGAIILLTEALRRAETERDAQAKEFARFKAVAALANSVVRWDSLLNEMHEQKARAQRAEQERDAQAALVATLTAERDVARAVKNGLHGIINHRERELSELTATRDLLLTENARLRKERDAARVVHACPPKGSGVMPCCGATPFEKQGERLTMDPALVNCDRQRLIAENARLQKEVAQCEKRNSDLSADAIQVASKYQRERDEARAQIATLELLRRGGK